MAVNFNNFYNKISNSGSDERGQYSGGTAGDQTGNEWNIRDWYSRPWTCVLRYPNQTARELIAELAIEAASNDKIGYDQNGRYTYWQELAKVGYRPSKITNACEADCSAGVIANTKAVGYLLNIPALKNLSIYGYTGSMKSTFKAAGFQVLTDSKYLTSSAYLVPGDILLLEGTHTATNLGIGSKSGYNNTNTGGTSVDTNSEIGKNTTSKPAYSTKELQTMLNLAGWSLKVDGDYGTETTKAAREFQTLYELEVDGYIGNDTAKVLKELQDIINAGFDATFYANTYSDVKKVYGTDKKQLLHHYYKWGIKENRKIKANSTTTTPTSTVKKEELTINTSGKYNTVPKEVGKVNVNLLNVRKGPGINYRNLVSYPQLALGNMVDICDLTIDAYNTKWYYIRIAGKYYGFASAEYITIV